MECGLRIADFILPNAAKHLTILNQSFINPESAIRNPLIPWLACHL
jgi:hypothetical protein